MGRDMPESYPRIMGETSGTRARKRPRGHIDKLPSGSLRVRVYAGKDVLTGKDRYLSEVIAPGPAAKDQAEHARHRLVQQVVSNRYARTDAPLEVLIEKYLENADLEQTTLDSYYTNLNKHIRPLIGK